MNAKLLSSTAHSSPAAEAHGHATIDFETRSAADIELGPRHYAKHETTQIHCLCYRLPWFKPGEVKTWHRAYPELGIPETPRSELEPLFAWIANGGLIEAHNAGFEENIWRWVAVVQHDWPAIDDNQWRCTAARAAAISLPRHLDGALAALQIPIRKDPEGKALIRRYCLPRKLTKFEKELHGADYVDWNEDVAGLEKLWAYCAQDILAEEALSNSIPDLSPTELRIWQTTLAMNRRGVLIDVELCQKALDLVEEARDRLNAELFKLTGIAKGSQRAECAAWLADNEMLLLGGTTAGEIEWFLERYPFPLTPRARRVLEIMREVNRTSPKKYQVMLDAIDPDTNRAHDLLAYCGAERTGRWAGQGIQVQNLPKGNLPKGYTMDDACRDVKTGDFDHCQLVYGDVMNLVVSCCRGAIIAPSGRELLVADYAAIEARCVLWLAGALDALKVFEGGGDIYLDMASGIFGREITKATAKVITSTGATERDFGKVAILGLGYGMGWIKFLLTLRTYKIYLTEAEVIQMMGAQRYSHWRAQADKALFPENYRDEFTRDGKFDPKRFAAAQREAKIQLRRLKDGREDPKRILHELALCKYTVGVYRARYEEVPAMWRNQEAAAIRAVTENREEWNAVDCGLVSWFMDGRFLKCRLPSGRCLHYCDAHTTPTKTTWGEVKPSIRFMGRDQRTKAWTRQGTYGGKLTENITQATARDVMGIAMVGLEDARSCDLLITVHDEAVAEADKGAVELPSFEAIMTRMPRNFDGCPITAESKSFERYRKG